MANFHPNFPFGKGLWIWELPVLLKRYGTLDAIIQKCKDNDISYVMLKSGDGENTWISQWNANTIKKFKDAGIKILAWMYNYGYNPSREAAVAMWSLDMGADGFVFNAEVEWRDLVNRREAAEQMLSMVRKHAPNAFLAHAPLAIPSYHAKFPYDIFGKYCDAVMPQVYWGTIYGGGVTNPASKIIDWMFREWSTLEAKWKAEGKETSIKPIIPAGQAYDNPKEKYILQPAHITEFLEYAKGYQSVNFWSFQHIVRDDCWDAIKRTPVTKLALPVPAEPAPPSPAPSPPTPPAEQPTRIEVTERTIKVDGQEFDREKLHVDYVMEFLKKILSIKK